MAVDLTPGAHFQRNTTALVLPVTFCAWVRLDTTPAVYRVVLYHGTTAYSQCLTLNQLASGVVSAEDENFITRAQTDVLSVGTWHFLGVSVASGAGNFKLYWRAEGAATLSSDTGTFSAGFAQQRLFWGTGPGDTSASTHSGAYAYARAFAAELSEAQLLAESQSTTAVATEWADWPMADTATSTGDVSGNSRDLTFNVGGGSQANDTDPDLGGATEHQATLVAGLGLAAAASLTVEHPATLAAELGGAAAFSATRDTAATATTDLGFTASASVTVDHPATVAADLGATASLAATVDHAATFTTDGGFTTDLAATIEGDDVQLEATADLGFNTTAALTVDHPVTVNAGLGGTAVLAATVDRTLIAAAALGFTAGLTVDDTADPNPTVVHIHDDHADTIADHADTLADRPLQRLRETA